VSSSTPSNPARPSPGLRLCALSEIAEPGARGFRFREGPSLFAGFVLRADGQVTGFVDSCPHAGWPLSTLDDRYLTRDGRRILCAGHGALFDLSGLCTVGPCEGDRLTAWPVDVRGGWVVTL
jgi:nitrite reductase/ring-hydroxylating ferredoxin subunit